MNATLRAMLEGVIDYAGLFPPAKLSVPDAVNEFLQIVHGSDQWIVDRFACSVGKLDDLSIELNQHPEEPFIPVAVIGTQQPDHKHWKHGLEHDAMVMTKFQQSAENHAEMQAFEVRVPDHAHLEEYVRDLRQFTNVEIFVELPWSKEMNDSLAVLAEMEFASAKVRTGGLEASAFPSSAELAGFIQQCSQLDLTFKLTAGLHHALPSVDPTTGGRMHGYLNVLTATALAMAQDLSTKEIESVLDETEAKAFQFKRDGLHYRDTRLKLEDIENSRTLLVSYGSCSVQEPLDDLNKLGLLEKVSR